MKIVFIFMVMAVLAGCFSKPGTMKFADEETQKRIFANYSNAYQEFRIEQALKAKEEVEK